MRLTKNGITRKPRFFRVSNADELSFPKYTFTSLKVQNVKASANLNKNGKEMQDMEIEVSWSVSKNFYYTDYDWAILYRKIGDEKNPNMFYKTPYSLNNHMKLDETWSPKSENLTGSIKSMQDTFYEVCLSVVDEEAVLYYLHSNHCKEIRTPKIDGEQTLDLHKIKETEDESDTIVQDSLPSFRDEIKTTNISVSSSSESITVSWQVLMNDVDFTGKEAGDNIVNVGKENKSKSSNEIISLIRKISLRPFSSENSTKLFVLEDFNRTQWKEKNDDAPVASRYYTLSNLLPNTPYVVCFETLPPQGRNADAPFEIETRKAGKSLRSWHETDTHQDMVDSVCMETSTANLNVTASVTDFPVTEVAAATAVSTTTTAIVIMIICCCCPTSCCKRRKGKNKSKDVEQQGIEEDSESNPSKDENENKLDSYEAKKLRAHLRKHSSPERSVHSSTTGGVGNSSYADQELLKNDCNQSSTTSDSEIRRLSHSKFHERYPAAGQCPQHNRNNPESIMKNSAETANSGPGLKFWKSCLSSSEKNMNTTTESHSDNNERQRVQIATISSSSNCSEINIEESELDNEDDVQLEETERGIQIKESSATKVYDGEPSYERSNEEIIVEEPPIVAQNVNMASSNRYHSNMLHTTHSLPRAKMRKDKSNNHTNTKTVESRGTQVKTSSSSKNPSANTDLTSEIECNGDCCNEHSGNKYPNYYTLPHPGSLQAPQQAFQSHLVNHQKGGCNQMLPRPLPPPRFLPNGTILPMYDSRREPPSTGYHSQGPYRIRGVPLDPSTLGPGSYATIANYQFHKRPPPVDYYTPPQPDYYRVFRPGEFNGQVPPSSHHPRFFNNMDYSAQTLGRTKKEAKAMGSTARNGINNYHSALLQNQHINPHHHQVNQVTLDLRLDLLPLLRRLNYALEGIK